MLSAIKAFVKKLFKKDQFKDTLYIGNLTYSATSSDLKVAFSKFGQIENARVIRDTKTQRSKGYGFITFKTSVAAVDALTMEGQEIKGRPVRVRIAHSKADAIS